MTRYRHALMGFLLAIATPSIAIAQTVAAVQPNEVRIEGVADMKSIADENLLDSFNFTVTDSQIKTTFDMDCTGAGHTAMFFIRKDRQCAFQRESGGSIFNPNSKQWLPRAQYLGSYVVTASGLTDASNISVNYNALSVSLPALNGVRFGGSLNLKPEQTSSGAAGLKAAVLQKIGASSEGLTNDAVDCIDFNRFAMPSAGLPPQMDPGVIWSGNTCYSYQTYSWYFQVSAEFQGKGYVLTGNMPFTGDSESESGVSIYNVVLTLPATATAAGAPTNFDDLFTDAAVGADLFATADGITGQITMDNTKIVATEIDGSTIRTPGHVVANGSFFGQGVPLEVTRSFVNIISLLPATFFGP